MAAAEAALVEVEVLQVQEPQTPAVAVVQEVIQVIILAAMADQV
jgi:hypothetical protein